MPLKGKPIIVARTVHGGGGLYLRVLQHLDILSRRGEALCALLTKDLSDDEQAKILAASDIIVGSAAFHTFNEVVTAQGDDAPPGLSYVRALDSFKRLMELGKRLVWDVDDDPLSVNPFNPAYMSFGLEEVEIEQLDGTKVDLWKDGKAGFDIARNRKTFADYTELLRSATALTTTTEYLRQKLLTLNPRVWVRPNVADFTGMWTHKVTPRGDGRIRILYHGGSSHFSDFAFIAPVLKEIAETYPHIVFQFLGQVHYFAKKLIPEERIQILPWEPDYRSMVLRLVMIAPDICIAPLNMGPQFAEFNRCKSPIKWVEAGAAGIPMVAQWDHPYSEAINHRSKPGADAEWNGFLASTPEEWFRLLSVLVQNIDARRTLAANARRDVCERWNAETWSETYMEQYREILAWEASRSQPVAVA